MGALPLLTTACGLLSGLNDLEIVDCSANCDAAAPTDGQQPPSGMVDAKDVGAAKEGSPPEVDAAQVDAQDDKTTPMDSATAIDARSDRAVVIDASSDTVDVTVDSVATDVASDLRTDPRIDVAIDADPDAEIPCPGTAGPTPVRVGAYCIDSTEVTNDHYAAFLATNPSTSALPAVCSFKTSFTPMGGWPAASGRGAYPVAYIDWCSAKAYCEWAGKRLCGAIGGGPSSRDSASNKNVDQWYAACSAGGTRGFPYGGNTYMSGRCNDAEALIGGAEAVASRTTCVGGSPGIYDMDGNLWEWEDGCDGQSGATDGCLIRGG
ncbi:MAG: SUMF1/EgtB/PvdO family nonheme iron enzyme, partial [Polyangiaceae bacterium]